MTSISAGQFEKITKMRNFESKKFENINKKEKEAITN